MSGGNALRKAFDYPAIQDSRAIAEIGRGLNIPALTAEAKHNEQNPGRAETKATINAALWYLGGELGDAFGSGGAAADTGATAGEIGAGVGEGGYDAMTAEQIAQQLAPVTAGENVGSMGGLLAGGTPETAQTAALLPQGIGNTMESALPDTGYTPSSLYQAVKNANAANGTPLSQNLANYYKDAATNLQNGGMANQFIAGAKGPAGKQLAIKTAMNVLTPQQPRPMPMGRPAPQGQQGPLTNPYQSGNPYQPSPYGQGGNSLGLTEEQKQKLRAMGVQI